MGETATVRLLRRFLRRGRSVFVSVSVLGSAVDGVGVGERSMSAGTRRGDDGGTGVVSL